MSKERLVLVTFVVLETRLVERPVEVGHEVANQAHGVLQTHGQTLGMRRYNGNVATSANVLFNDALNTFYLRLYGVGHMVKDQSYSVREETRCRHIGYSFRIAAMVLLYALSHLQDGTYHGLCYTSRGAVAGTGSQIQVY